MVKYSHENNKENGKSLDINAEDDKKGVPLRRGGVCAVRGESLGG
jgi:hypothetical protein